MTTVTTSDSSTYSLYISSSMVHYDSRTDSDENDSKYVIKSHVCPVGRLSDRDEEILIVQGLPQQIEPNHRVSQVVSRAIARHAERVDRQTELVENRFKSINDEIERRIANASQVLDECLDFIDSSLSNVLRDRQSDEYMRFDWLQTCFLTVDELINRRNGKIDDFMNALRGLEKERTTLVEDCYKRYMLDVKQLSADSYGRLYEKYLKNYNAIKLGNFRTYEDLRFKLVQSSASVRHEFALRAHDVRSTIKNNVARNFMETFKTAAALIASDKVSTSRTVSINLLHDLTGLFNELAQRSKYGVDVAFVLECSDLLKKRSDTLDAIVDGTAPLHGEVREAVQSLLKRTADEHVRTIAGSGEHLSPGELTAVNDEMSVEASAAEREKIKDVLDVQLFLNDVRHAVGAIGTVLGPALGMVRGHTERLMKARNTVLATLEKTFKRNDSKSNILEKQLDDALDALVRASDETDVIQYREICDDTMEHIENRTEVDRQREIKVVSNFKDLMASELEAIRSEARKIHVNVSMPEFNYATQGDCWTTSVTSAITSFKTALKTCLQTLHKQLSSFIAKLKFTDFSNNECALANLKYVIDERFNVKSKVFELRAIALRDGIANKKLDDIERHRSLLERHIKDAREKNDSLRHDTKQMYKIFDLKTNDLILKNVELVGSHVEELSLSELTELIEKLRRKIDSVADELNNTYKSHYDKVESEYQAIEDSTLEFIKSIKMFSEGGNYGDEEAVYTVNALNMLKNKMSQERSNIIKTLTMHSYEPTTGIKELLGRRMKPLEIELGKKVCRQTYNSINKLVNIVVSQNISKLEKNMDFLRAKLHDVKNVLEKGEIKESSKCWSEMLSETKAFMDFLLQSFRDIKSLLKSNIKFSIWNSENEKSNASSSVISVKSTQTFPSGGSEFFDQDKSIVQSETTGGRRFLNDVYLSLSHYISESQKNAADLALAESSANTENGEQPNAAQIYNKIMDEALKRSKTIFLQAELVWIVTLSDFFDFLRREYHEAESEFKNAVLMTYHEESVTKMDVAFAAFDRESNEVRKRFKKIREEIDYMLKPSHGHPLNAQRLNKLLADFRRANSECLNTLMDTFTGIETKLKKIVESYEKECPTDVLKAITLSVKRYSNVKNKLDLINIKVIDTGYEFEIMSETMATRITATDTIELALNNVKDHLRTEPGAVFWPKNKLLWTNNVQAFRKLYRDRLGDVRVFSAVEKSKSIDWATNFVRDVERVKGFYDNEDNCWRAPL